jgi:hypothetical protein
VGGGENSAPGLLLSTCCCIHLQPPLTYVNKPKALFAIESNRVVITVNGRVKKMARSLERDVEKYGGEHWPVELSYMVSMMTEKSIELRQYKNFLLLIKSM